MATASAPALLSVGSRVSDKHRNRGTVRYLGPVSISYKEPDCVWAGVEWDEAGRGKYDGSVTDKTGTTTRYFTCDPTRGSFIKPSKLAPRLLFLDAVRQKYLTHDAINAEYRGAGSIKISAAWENNKTFDVELVGIDKIQKHLQLSVIDKVSLENENVGVLEPGAGLGEAVPNIEELNLENTLLSSWDEVFVLLRQLPKLQRLYLGHNRLQPPSAAQESVGGGDDAGGVGGAGGAAAAAAAGESFPLKVLVLNNTGTDWAGACALAAFFPDLEELHLEQNGIDFAAAADGGTPPVPAAVADAADTGATAAAAPAAAGATCPFPKLQRLNLSYNGIENWAAVAQFSAWPSLRHLLLNGNKLATVAWPAGCNAPTAAATAVSAASTATVSDGGGDGGGGGGAAAEGTGAEAEAPAAAATPDAFFFDQLQCISLSENGISSWASVDALNALPALVALNFEGNPIGGGGLGPRQVRQLLIARVGRLATLNNSQVRRKERLDAEKQYIKSVLLETEKTWDQMDDAQRATTAAAHPRFKALVDAHGLPASFRTGGFAGAASSLGMVTVTLRSIAVGSASAKPKQQRLATTMLVGSLRKLCARLFKIELAKVELVYQEPDALSIPQVLEDDSVSLAYYGVFDGGEIVVHNADDNKKKKKPQ